MNDPSIGVAYISLNLVFKKNTKTKNYYKFKITVVFIVIYMYTYHICRIIHKRIYEYINSVLQFHISHKIITLNIYLKLQH
jgi:hypothetical protein